MNSRDKITQEIIAVKYRSKKEEKFDAIYRAYADDIYRVCVYFVKDEDVAQEIAQRTFVDFYEHFENVNPDYMFAYLVRTAKDLVYSYQKDSEKEAVKPYER